MGNICASERNKECLYVAKEPHEVINQFNDCVVYRKKPDSKKILKKRKRKLLRRIETIDNQLETKSYG